MLRRLLRSWFGPKTLREKYSELADRSSRSRPVQNPGERLVHKLVWLDAETSNGSLSQYVTNSTGDTFHEVVDYLTEIGASDTRDVLLQLAHAAFPSNVVPKDRTERCLLFEAWEREPGSQETVASLTRRYRENHENLMRAVVAYAERHPEHFPWLVA